MIRGRAWGCQDQLKAANSRVRRFLDAKARQLGVGKLVVVESRGRFVLMEHLSRAKCRWGGEESPESGSSDTNGLQPCCALFLAIPAGRSGQSRVRIRRLFCFGPPWRVAPAPDGRRLTHSNVGRALEMPETGYGGTTRLAASPIRQPWRRASRKGLSVRTLALVSASLTSRPAQAGTPGRR